MLILLCFPPFLFFFPSLFFIMASSSSVHFRIVNVTDVYSLKYFPSLKTLLNEKKGESGVNQTVSILTGDFLAPYLLSSIDKGVGMMKMLNETPIDIVTFGNHEDDLDHQSVCRRTREFKGAWINTNMQSHEMFEKYHKPYHIIEVSSDDKTHTRKIGFIAVLSDSPSLYRKNAFNGAKIECPYETMKKYKEILEKEHNCDIVIPLCHLYVPQDKVTCERFDFPVVLSGHDHHVVQETFFGTLLLKAGSDAKNAVVLDLVWENPQQKTPTFNAKIEKVSSFEKDGNLQKVVERCYSVLDFLKHTEVCHVQEKFRPLSSDGSRNRVCTVGKFICSMIREAFNHDAIEENNVEAVILSGGDIRGGTNYPADSRFTMESLKNEIQTELSICVVQVPGRVLAEGIPASQFGPNPGYLQFDDEIVQESDGGKITHIAGKLVEPDRLYRTAMTLWDIQDGPSAPIKNYFKEHQDEIPCEDAAWPVYSALISHFAKGIWQTVFQRVIDADGDGKISKEELRAIDLDGDGRLSIAEVKILIQKAGFDIDDKDEEFISHVMTIAGDVDQDGYLDQKELGMKSEEK